MVSVYDCSFVRYPELCTPEVRAFVPIVRRAIARGATVHTTSEFVAGEIEEIFGPGLRRRGRLVVIPLGVPSIGTDAEMPAAVAHAARGRAVRARDRDARAAEEPRAPRRRVRDDRGDASRSASRHRRPGRSGPARRRRRDRAPRPRRRVRVSLLPGPVSDAGRARAARRRRAARVPVDLRRLRLPGARSDDGRRAGRRGARGLDPGGRGRRRVARRADRRGATRRRDHAVCSPTTRTRRELIARGRDRVREFSWEDTALRPRRVLSPARGGGAGRSMRVACHAGQLLQPVPGRHRPLRPRAARAAPRRRRRAGRVRGRRAARATCPARVPWIDLGRPSGSVRYELWHRTRHPVVRLDVDVVHAPSLAVPPVRGAPLVVTVHDIAFLRVPAEHDAPRRGVPPARLRASRGAKRRSCSRRPRSRASS